jgi:serine/threonine protein kinase
MADYLDSYQLGKQLGYGASCTVRMGRKGNERFAIKIFNREKLSSGEINKLINKEVKIQMSLPEHENVVKIIEYSESSVLKKANGKNRNVAYIVLEYVDGNELLDLLMDNGGFSEELGRYVFKMMLRGLNHCHSNGITHRDLKPDNMMLTKDGIVKLVDFGLSSTLVGTKKDGYCRTAYGTKAYMAPEIFVGKYDGIKVDIYAMGIILFILIFNAFPLDVARIEDPKFKALLKGNWEDFWKLYYRERSREGLADISDELKSLISLMIIPDADCRPNLSDVIAHPWMSGPTSTKEEADAEFTRRREANAAQSQ